MILYWRMQLELPDWHFVVICISWNQRGITRTYLIQPFCRSQNFPGGHFAESTDVTKIRKKNAMTQLDISTQLNWYFQYLAVLQCCCTFIQEDMRFIYKHSHVKIIDLLIMPWSHEGFILLLCYGSDDGFILIYYLYPQDKNKYTLWRFFQ